MRTNHALLPVFTVLALAVAAQGRQEKMTITKIEFQGLARYSEAQAASASGLRIGQVVRTSDLDAAANRLISSGLFKRANYRYSAIDDRAALTFEVEEVKWGVPVIFDNFAWFSDEELQAAVALEVPSFDGTAPGSGAVIDTIRGALEKLLRQRGIAGQVECLQSSEFSGRNREHICSAKGPALTSCSIHFTGCSDIPEADLVGASKSMLGGEYSRWEIGDFARHTLFSLYRKRGHLRAGFGIAQAKLEESSSCKNGVSRDAQRAGGPGLFLGKG